jgi:hypothetical protein
MSERTLNRRQAVRAAAGVAAGGVLVAGAGVGSASAHDDKGKGLVGSWLVTHRQDPPNPPEVGIAVVSVIAGGVIISNDIKPANPTGSGSWESRGHDRFKATFWSGFPGTDTEPAGTVRIQVSGRLHNGRISGTFTITVYDADDNVVFSGTGTFTGRRLRA